MTFTSVTIKDLSTSPPSVNTNVGAKTRVRSTGHPDDQIVKGVTSRQELRLRNKVAGQTYVFRVTSVSQDSAVVSYSDGDPGEWAPKVTVSGPSNWRGARWTKRAAAVQHGGSCAAGNAHTIHVSVEVGTLNPLEDPAFESDDLFYEVTCQC